MLRLALTGIALAFYAVVALAAGGFGVGNNLTGFWQKKSGSIPPSVTFINCLEDTSSPFSQSFNLGAEDATRAVLIIITAEDNATVYTVDSVTVDGVAATERNDHGGVYNASAALYSKSHPTGGTVTIAATFSEALTGGAQICVWSAYNLSSIIPTANATNGAASGASVDLSLNTTALGVGVAACATVAAGGTWTWAGYNEVLDAGGTNTGHTAANFTEDDTVSTPLTISCDPSGTGQSAGSAGFFR